VIEAKEVIIHGAATIAPMPWYHCTTTMVSARDG
jgi:hypothetical protein